MHPRPLRCSSVKYSRYSPSSAPCHPGASAVSLASISLLRATRLGVVDTASIHALLSDPVPRPRGHEEKQVLATYLTEHKLKRSEQREIILDEFLRTKRHVSVDDLLQIVQQRRPDIGRTTVYRTLKLLKEAGLAAELRIGAETRYESDYKREHHDHFMCKYCGEIFEFVSAEVERIQDEFAKQIGFTIEGHRHHIYGRCRKCAPRPQRSH